MGINKVQYGNTTLIDLTADTVTADKLMQGYTAHDRSGALIIGTATGGSGAISVVDTPDTHGGTIRTITAIDISDTTAQASDVASGKYFYTADGTKTAGTGSGGGASNFVTGTFTGTTDGAMNVTIPYSGNGYPIIINIYPTEGAYNPNGEYYETIHRYSINCVTAFKEVPNTLPTYDTTDANNNYTIIDRYKSSESVATSVGSTGFNSIKVTNGGDATNTNVGWLKFKTKSTMSVYIATTGYGFNNGTEYTYNIEYSA